MGVFDDASDSVSNAANSAADSVGNAVSDATAAAENAAKEAQAAAENAAKEAQAAAEQAAADARKAAEDAAQSAKDAAEEAVTKARQATEKAIDEAVAKAKEAAQAAEDAARKAAQEAADTARKAVEDARQRVEQVIDETVDKAKQTADKLIDEAAKKAQEAEQAAKDAVKNAKQAAEQAIDQAVNQARNAADAIADKFSNLPVGDVVQTCSVKTFKDDLTALTEKEAQELFDHFAKNRPDIPFDYPVDCCFTRARSMVNDAKMKALEARGVVVKKAWNYASDFGDRVKKKAPSLMVPTPDDLMPGFGNKVINWIYHVAPTVPVRGADGVIRRMVLDPAMAKSPITMEKWKAMQNDAKSVLKEFDKDKYIYFPPGLLPQYPNGLEYPDPGDEGAKQKLEEHKIDRDMLRAAGL